MDGMMLPCLLLFGGCVVSFVPPPPPLRVDIGFTSFTLKVTWPDKRQKSKGDKGSSEGTRTEHRKKRDAQDVCEQAARDDKSRFRRAACCAGAECVCWGDSAVGRRREKMRAATRCAFGDASITICSEFYSVCTGKQTHTITNKQTNRRKKKEKKRMRCHDDAARGKADGRREVCMLHVCACSVLLLLTI